MYCAGIDIHNHVRTGSLGYEDIWHTRNAIHRQFAGITGFLFTNAYSAKNYFQRKNIKHVDFKMVLSNQMVAYSADMGYIARSLLKNPATLIEGNGVNVHYIKKLADVGIQSQKPCFYCQHGLHVSKRVKTSYYCTEYGKDKALCSPTSSRDCFQLHVEYGLPTKRYSKKN